MRIKVCGMREPENTKALAQLAVDYIGFIFYKNSPRYVGEETLIGFLEDNKMLLLNLTRVGVFVNAEIEYVLNKVHDYKLDFVQLHGDESPEYCMELQSYWDISTMRRAQLIKAFGVDENFDFEATEAYERSCSMFLFDTKAGKQYGGTGPRFDWSVLQDYQGNHPFLLSGGIDEDTADQIKHLDIPQLHGIDLNSKFETEPGLKDIDKIKRFLEKLQL